MKNVTIAPGCTTCGVCEFIAPEVFEVTNISHVKEDFDFNKNKDLIDQASRACPVSVIIVDGKE